ncbi:MAG TPA: hypothetical protein VFY10_11415, partial [Dehalococcoidia bacterium]|nr:hypothetical protein [Dehalococcoidia bacterium]
MLTETAFAAYIKRKFDPKYIDNSMTSRMSPSFKAVTKDTSGGGDFLTYLEDDDDDFGASADFTVSQNQAINNSQTLGNQYQFPWMPGYEVAQLTTAVINKTRNNDSAWQSAISVKMKKKLAAMAHLNGVLFQGQGWGELFKIANVSGSTFTVANRVSGNVSDAPKAVQGMPVVFAPDLNVSALRSATVRTVLSVDYTSGLVTLDGTLAGVSAVNGDFCFIAGCRQNAGSPSRLVWVGLDAHIPDRQSALTDNTVITLGGVNRANNPRTYGTYFDASTGGSLLGAIINGVQEASTIGGATHLELFCSRANFAQFALDMQNAVRYDGDTKERVVGNAKRVHFYSDGTCDAYLNVDKLTNDLQVWGFDPA